MTIQVSVIVWTVISFCVLAFVLNKFLFKPMFRVMDARAEKIARSAKEKEDEQNARTAHRQEAEQEHAAEVRAAFEKDAAAVETARSENKQRVLDHRAEHNNGIEQFGTELEAESEKIRNSYSGETDGLAEEFAEAFSHNTFPYETKPKVKYDDLIASALKAVEQKIAKASKHAVRDDFTSEPDEPADGVYRTEDERRIAEAKKAQRAKLTELRAELQQESDEIKKKYSDDADGLALKYVSTIIQ